MTLVQGVNYAATTFAFGAAVLWAISASVQTPKSFSIVVDVSRSTWDGSVRALAPALICYISPKR